MVYYTKQIAYKDGERDGHITRFYITYNVEIISVN